jgi:hypothetical protein
MSLRGESFHRVGVLVLLLRSCAFAPGNPGPDPGPGSHTMMPAPGEKSGCLDGRSPVSPTRARSRSSGSKCLVLSAVTAPRSLRSGGTVTEF